MKLNLEKIREITVGAARVEEKDGEIYFYRYTKEQDERYRIRNPELRRRSLCTSGIKLQFNTDSEKLFLKIKTEQVLSRSYFSVDVFVNGEILGYLDNFGDSVIDGNYIALKLPQGEFSKNFKLGKGEKRVCVQLPWSVICSLSEICLDDGSFVSGIRKEKKLIAFGDSITQGFDAFRSSERYISRLADALGADEYNKAIGGDIFFPDLAALCDDFTPDYVVVAYGTNDWNTVSESEFKHNCRLFYENLARNYPKARIFALTPIWRADYQDQKPFGNFKNVSDDIKEAVKSLSNVMVIDGFDLVPHDRRYFSDKYLHPNSEGFEQYFKNLCAAIDI